MGVEKESLEDLCFNKNCDPIFQQTAKNGKKLCSFSAWVNFKYKTNAKLMKFAEKRYKLYKKKFGCPYILFQLYVVNDTTYFLGCGFNCRRKKKK